MKSDSPAGRPMTDETISVTKLARNLADFINRVSYRGERFIVTRGRRPVAELVPAPRGRRLGELGTALNSLPGLGVEEAEALARDLDRARSVLRDPEHPWES